MLDSVRKQSIEDNAIHNSRMNLSLSELHHDKNPGTELN